MGQTRSYKQYPKEFKEEAVALVRDQGYSVPEAAKSLGVASNLLYRWKDQQGQLAAGKGLTVTEDDRVELQRLRKENKALRMEKEVLKKASAFFCEKNEVKYHFIKRHAQSYTVRLLCRVMKVGKSAFYAWKASPAPLITAHEQHMYRRVKVLFEVSRYKAMEILA